jgi:tRNA threonylcarbamoyladenosine biosynthesis protein TsaB
MKNHIFPLSSSDIYLAFDTSTEVGSVCICQDRKILNSSIFSGQGRHSADLLSKIQEVIDKEELTIADIQGVIVGEGPGSFTGVRVAAATAKGLCYSLGVPLWAVSSLRASAVSIDMSSEISMHVNPEKQVAPSDSRLMIDHSSPKCVLFDARGNRVYAACYRSKGPGITETILAPHSTTIESILLACEVSTIFGGDGAHRHFDQICEAGFQVITHPTGRPTAQALCEIVIDSGNKFRVEHIPAWEPKYLRVSSAERLKKKKDP